MNSENNLQDCNSIETLLTHPAVVAAADMILIKSGLYQRAGVHPQVIAPSAIEAIATACAEVLKKRDAEFTAERDALLAQVAAMKEVLEFVKQHAVFGLGYIKDKPFERIDTALTGPFLPVVAVSDVLPVLKAVHAGIWHRVYTEQNPNYQVTLDCLDTLITKLKMMIK